MIRHVDPEFGALLVRAYGRMPRGYLATKPRLIRWCGLWYCGLGLVFRGGVVGWQTGPVTKGLTPRIAYDAWRREMNQ